MRLHFLLLGATVLTGCAVGPTFHPPVAALTPSFLGAAAIDTQAEPADWWRGFNDPLLASLIARAVASNTDIAQARARLAQSRAAAQGAGAALLPTLDATGDVTTLSQSL